MINWVVEKEGSGRQKKWNEQISLTCSAIGSRYIEIQIVPFERSVVGGDPVTDGPTIAYGSTAISDVVDRNTWTPGIFKIGDESEVSAALGTDYMNHDMRVLPPDEVLDYAKQYEYFFIKPDKDTKSFDGTVIDAGRYLYFIEKHKQFSGYDTETKVCVSPLKDIEKEWRIFVVDGKVISWSLYQEKRMLKIARSIDPLAVKFAQSAIEKYNPCKAFVVDVAKVSGEYKVIEYNTFNHSGFYDCDVQAIVKAVNNAL